MSATMKALRPARLDIVDLPRDEQRCLGGLRSALCATFNYVRQHPVKMDVFITVLEYVLERAKEYRDGVVDTAIAAQLEAKEAEAKAAEEAILAMRKAELDAQITKIKDEGKQIMASAQGITELVELKEYIIAQGFEVEGETLEDIKTAFVKAKTSQLLAVIADLKATDKEEE